MTRILDAYCPTCADAVGHDLLDMGSCRCTGCGSVQLLSSPLA